MTLEDILQNYLGLKGSLWSLEEKYGQERIWTPEGYMAYEKLTDLIYDLSKVTNTFNANEVIDDLDEIEFLND